MATSPRMSIRLVQPSISLSTPINTRESWYLDNIDSSDSYFTNYKNTANEPAESDNRSWSSRLFLPGESSSPPVTPNSPEASLLKSEIYQPNSRPLSIFGNIVSDLAEPLAVSQLSIAGYRNEVSSVPQHDMSHRMIDGIVFHPAASRSATSGIGAAIVTEHSYRTLFEFNDRAKGWGSAKRNARAGSAAAMEKQIHSIRLLRWMHEAGKLFWGSLYRRSRSLKRSAGQNLQQAE